MGALTISQLEPPRHVLELRGLAGPLTGWTWGGFEARGEARYSNGSPDATAHLAGPEWTPSSFPFEWYSRRLGRGDFARFGGQQITDADELVRRVRQAFAQPVAVQVEWNGETCVGYVSMMEPEPGKAGEWRVTLEVTPIKHDLGAQIAATPSPRDALGALAVVRRTWAAGLAAVEAPANVARSTLAPALRAVNEVNAALGRASGVVDTYREGARDLRAVRGGTAEAFRSVSTAATTLRETADTPSGEMVGTDDAASQIRAGLYSSRLQSVSQKVITRSVIEERRQRLAERRDLIGLHIATDGEDLRLVCWHAYGDPSAWWDVARFNQLTGPILTAGQRILLPVRSAGAAA